MGTWMNSDGLYIKLGTSEATMGKAGEYSTLGPERMTELTLNLTDVTNANVITEDNVMIPAGAQIQRVEVKTLVAATGASSTLDVGFYRTDRTTELDWDGILAAFTLASMDAIGETNTYTIAGSTAGALVGTVLANTGLLSVKWGTAAFTAGKIAIRIYWSVRT